MQIVQTDVNTLPFYLRKFCMRVSMLYIVVLPKIKGCNQNI